MAASLPVRAVLVQATTVVQAITAVQVTMVVLFSMGRRRPLTIIMAVSTMVIRPRITAMRRMVIWVGAVA